MTIICMLKYIDVPYCFTKLQYLKLLNFPEIKGPKVQVYNNHWFTEKKKTFSLLETMKMLCSSIPLQQSEIH